ncbi:TPA: hypothetical protein P5S08_002483 [Salmonella enterica subsp. enterica serovar Concord]|nr:hypothetical protein [Salmonella enterica subsp. enterica serovar Concord]
MMTEYTHSPAADSVILYGDCWPVVSAVQHIVGAIVPDRHCVVAPDVNALIRLLACRPEAVLILCLRPREHVFLFYALRQELSEHPALIISDEMFFNDRLMLRVWGDLPCMMHDELSMMVTDVRLCELFSPPRIYYPAKNVLTGFLISPKFPVISTEVPPDFHLEAPLMDYLSLLMYNTMINKGLTPFRIRLLNSIWSGCQHQEALSLQLNVHPRKIWNDKHRLMAQLDMKGSLREVIYGTRFCSFIQRTRFMPPAEVEQIRQMATEKACFRCKEKPLCHPVT